MGPASMLAHGRGDGDAFRHHQRYGINGDGDAAGARAIGYVVLHWDVDV